MFPTALFHHQQEYAKKSSRRAAVIDGSSTRTALSRRVPRITKIFPANPSCPVQRSKPSFVINFAANFKSAGISPSSVSPHHPQRNRPDRLHVRLHLFPVAHRRA